MAATVDISRVYLNEDGQGVITCHHCDAQRPIQTSQHLHESIHRKLINSELTPCNRNTSYQAALRVFAIFTFTLCSTWLVMTRNRSACCS